MKFVFVLEFFLFLLLWNLGKSEKTEWLHYKTLLYINREIASTIGLLHFFLVVFFVIRENFSLFKLYLW
jgi:hypothetical protein